MPAFTNTIKRSSVRILLYQNTKEEFLHGDIALWLCQKKVEKKNGI